MDGCGHTTQSDKNRTDSRGESAALALQRATARSVTAAATFPRWASHSVSWAATQSSRFVVTLLSEHGRPAFLTGEHCTDELTNPPCASTAPIAEE